MSHPGTQKNGIGMVQTSKNVMKLLKLLLTGIVKHPVVYVVCSLRPLQMQIFGKIKKVHNLSSEKCFRGDYRYHAIYEAVAALVLCSGVKKVFRSS